MGKKPVNISPAQFIYLYRDEKKSGLEIARFFGIGRTTVSRYIKKFNLEPRSIAEVRKNNHWNGGESQRQSAIKLGKKRVGELNPNYKGGHVNVTGYRVIYINGRQYKEHRYVVEQLIGRKLKQFEDIHHINGDKLDNRVENLQLLSKSDHANLHWSRIERRQLQSDKIKHVRQERNWSTKKLS